MSVSVLSKLFPAMRVPEVRMAGMCRCHNARRSCSGVSRLAAQRLGLPSRSYWMVRMYWRFPVKKRPRICSVVPSR